MDDLLKKLFIVDDINHLSYEEYLDVSRKMFMSAVKYYFLDDKKEALKPSFYSFYKLCYIRIS